MVNIEFIESNIQELIWLCNDLILKKDYESANHLRHSLVHIAQAMLEDGDPIFFPLFDELAGVLKPLAKMKKSSHRSYISNQEIQDLLQEIEGFMEGIIFDEEIEEYVKKSLVRIEKKRDG